MASSFDGCQAACAAEPNCFIFTFKQGQLCRYSSCGSDPGPDPCPSDLQCPLSSSHNYVKVYGLYGEFLPTGNGLCDWHYKSGDASDLKKCRDACAAEPNCKLFTFQQGQFCRYSSCGTDPGPNSCPAN